MSTAGAIVLRKNRYLHFHLLGDHDEPVLSEAAPLSTKWTILHGFIAGFGFGGFSLFVNTVAAPAMQSPWLGFLPGLVFGLGTMIMLVIVGFIFGASLRWTHLLSEQEIKRIGSKTGGRTLFFGGLLFALFGIVTLAGIDRNLPVDAGYVLIGLFMIVIAVPAFIYTLKEVLAKRKISSHSE
jgi:hypothetical protein